MSTRKTYYTMEAPETKKNQKEIKMSLKLLRTLAMTEILDMCKTSYPQLELEKVCGYSIEKNGKEIFIIEGTDAFLIIKDL